MLTLKVLTNGGSMLGYALEKVLSRVANIIRVARITFKYVNNAVSIYNRRFNFLRLQIFFKAVSSNKDRLQHHSNFVTQRFHLSSDGVSRFLILVACMGSKFVLLLPLADPFL